jgi:hypothetical protein
MRLPSPTSSIPLSYGSNAASESVTPELLPTVPDQSIPPCRPVAATVLIEEASSHHATEVNALVWAGETYFDDSRLDEAQSATKNAPPA